MRQQIPCAAAHGSGRRTAECCLQPDSVAMDIRVVSTLTPDDEERVAAALLAALAELLDGLPIAYAVRIRTTSSRVVQRTNLSMRNDLPSVLQ